MKKSLLLLLFTGFSQVFGQSNDFSLASPFNEPDDRHDVVKITDTDIITLAKVKGNVSSKSDFVLERYGYDLKPQWKMPMTAESSEDYKDLYYNGKEVILLSVIHKETEKKTTLVAYGFDPTNGKQTWNKTLESYTVGEWENHNHKGKVKESFTDVVCEHVNQSYVTPFEYKHNVHFSPDKEKFISYVFNYGEKNLTASICVYDKSCNLLSKGKVSIDDNYINQGIYINNEGKVFILNSNMSGKLNIIRFDLTTKDFDILELAGSNFVKDDFHIIFLSNTKLLVSCSEQVAGVLMGVMYTRFDFENKTVEEPIFESISGSKASKFLEQRKASKLMKGEEDWKDYDITHFIQDKNENIYIILEKRHLYSDGYPHIGRDVFDASHKLEINGHVQAEGILMFCFNKSNQLAWSGYIPKNQIYAASDGLNSVSFTLHETDNQFKILYSYSENMDGMLYALKCITVDKQSGNKTETSLPNDLKIIPVREYTTLYKDGTVVLVGKRGLLGKASSIVRFKL